MDAQMDSGPKYDTPFPAPLNGGGDRKMPAYY